MSCSYADVENIMAMPDKQGHTAILVFEDDEGGLVANWMEHEIHAPTLQDMNRMLTALKVPEPRTLFRMAESW